MGTGACVMIRRVPVAGVVAAKLVPFRISGTRHLRPSTVFRAYGTLWRDQAHVCVVFICFTDTLLDRVVVRWCCCGALFYVLTPNLPVAVPPPRPLPQEIALPIHLGLIQQRLQRKYYRRAEGVFADLRLLETNCRTYNPAGRCDSVTSTSNGADLRSDGIQERQQQQGRSDGTQSVATATAGTRAMALNCVASISRNRRDVLLGI